MKRTEKKKKTIKHGALNAKLSKKHDLFSEEEKEDIKDSLDPFSYEEYCINCDNFDTEKCPFLGKTSAITKWHNLGCKNFWD